MDEQIPFFQSIEMNPTTYGLMFAGGLFLDLLLLLETGRRIALRRLAQDPEGARQGLGVVEGAVFSLLGLLDRVHSFRCRDAF